MTASVSLIISMFALNIPSALVSFLSEGINA
jgi:hypothetical protein